MLAAAEDRSPGQAEVDALAAATPDDPIPSAFLPGGATVSPRAVIRERIDLLKGVLEPFTDWWRSYFSDSRGVEVPLTELWRLYLPLAQWIVHEKRRLRPDGLFMVGFNGSPGAGKTVLTNALAVVLNHLLDSAEGQAVARSGDDWYLGREERELLRGHGYAPGVPGVSNRSLPGTHDLGWLKRNLHEMELSGEASTIRMGSFDKRTDDQPADADRYVEIRGKVGVFLFDLWYAGARTDVDPLKLPRGLQRKVAENLPEWRTVFERIDALWVFDWPPFEQMVREREAQERLVEQRHGTRGLSREHVRAFMAYMIEKGWDWRTTSPVPPDSAVTFHAWRDTHHRVIAVRKGGRAA
ncbi:kinase-like protein [Streptomyces sp. NPDC002845]